jgi:hypothetical protein
LNKNKNENENENENENANENKKCIICGCSGHSLFGCFSHWTGHKKNNGMCNNQ